MKRTNEKLQNAIGDEMITKHIEIAGVKITGFKNSDCQKVINGNSISFLRELHEKFNPRRLELMNARTTRYTTPSDINFPNDEYSQMVRSTNWKVGTIPKDLTCRHVEITGPTTANIVANALKCNANCFMADFEDATSPTWENITVGQLNLFNAIRGKLNYTSKEGKTYTYNEADANAENRTTLLCRPRGWHLNEKNMKLDGEEFSGSLTDFGLYTFGNHEELTKKGSGVYFYLPKLEHYEEAALWADVFSFTEKILDMPAGSIKATVLIETLPASFQLEEILYSLKNNIVGLNCGRWDYIFSAIKCLHSLPNYIFPNRNLIDMNTPFMDAYSKLVVKTCHARGAYAMGGMSANIPIKNDEVANKNMLNIIKTRKENEIANGHDGTWVAHPGLVPLVVEVYKEKLGRDNQLDKTNEGFIASKELLTQKPNGEITEEGLVENVTAALIYMEGWLRGDGCLAVNHLMEDAATAEISRSQLWQWVHGKAKLSNGKECTMERVAKTIDDVCTEAKKKNGIIPHYWNEAATFLKNFTKMNTLLPFMTTEMYRILH